MRSLYVVLYMSYAYATLTRNIYMFCPLFKGGFNGGTYLQVLKKVFNPVVNVRFNINYLYSLLSYIHDNN